MRHNRRGEPIGRESGVYLYAASGPEVCRKVDPVGVTSAAVRDQASTPLDCWPEPRNAVPHKTILFLMRPNGLGRHLIDVRKATRRTKRRMLRAQHKSRSSLCEVCRSQPAEVVVVEFIFACDRCAEKIRAATGDQRANTGNPFSPVRTETKPSIPRLRRPESEQS
jgi:hypothetical protein